MSTRDIAACYVRLYGLQKVLSYVIWRKATQLPTKVRYASKCIGARASQRQDRPLVWLEDLLGGTIEIFGMLLLVGSHPRIKVVGVWIAFHYNADTIFGPAFW